MKKILSAPAVLLVAAGALVSCSSPAEDTTSEIALEEQPETYTQYVALGDSYAAMGSRSAETSGPTECFRSADNYPGGVAEHERIENFVDATCASAVTADITMTRAGDEAPIPPQVESLFEETDLVTISIGGNDIGFPDIAGCFQEALASGQESDCASQFNSEELFASLDELLFHVYSTVQERSPNADVYVTGYMPLIADEGECHDAAFISEEDRIWAVSLTDDLNGHIEDVAANLRIPFILPENADEYTVCATVDERWTDLTGAETGAYPMHPTARGQEAMAEAVKEQL